jgi:hypothetical protein
MLIEFVIASKEWYMPVPEQRSLFAPESCQPVLRGYCISVTPCLKKRIKARVDIRSAERSKNSKMMQNKKS